MCTTTYHRFRKVLRARAVSLYYNVNDTTESLLDLAFAFATTPHDTVAKFASGVKGSYLAGSYMSPASVGTREHPLEVVFVHT